MIYTYAPDALVYDTATGTWSLARDYDHTTDRVELSVWDDDSHFDGDLSYDEVGEDWNQIGEVRTLDGTLIASGRIYDEHYYALQIPGRGTLYLERIEIAGQFVCWAVTEPLEAGISYVQTGEGDVDDGFLGIGDTRLRYSSIHSVPCFAAGTMIATEEGDQPVDWIRTGDRVLTRDNGFQPVLWAGRFHALPAGSGAPLLVEIAADAFGEGMPARPLRVSPQHRLLLATPRLELHFGSHEMLGPAKGLIDGAEVRGLRPPEGVVFHHLLFARHEVILSEGLWSESLFPGETVLSAQPAALRARLRALAGPTPWETARPCLRLREMQMLKLSLADCRCGAEAA